MVKALIVKSCNIRYLLTYSNTLIPERSKLAGHGVFIHKCRSPVINILGFNKTGKLLVNINDLI